MLKVLFITASKDASGKTNVGDRVILAGARNLIAGAFGAYVYQEIGRWGEYPKGADQYDLVVYAGMPQYGGRTGPTPVEQRFQDYMDSAKSAVFINIGGGTPTGIDFDVETSSSNMANAGIGRFYEKQTRIALRTTRDLVGKRFFDKINSPCDLRPCPSFFSTMHMADVPKTRNAIAFLSDDTFVTNRVRGNMADHLKELIACLPGYELAAHSKGDLVQLGRIGKEHLYFRTEIDAIDYYSTVGTLAALRIHAGVPSWTQGANVVVGAFDGRARMFADVGMPLPVIDLVNNDFSALAKMVLDPKTHTPYEKRKELIVAAYKSFVGRLRETCPSLAERAQTAVQTLEGFAQYPFDGAVEKASDFDGYLPIRRVRPPQIVPESNSGITGCVVIPAGSVAENGRDSEEAFQQHYLGNTFTAGNGAVSEGVVELPLGNKTGLLARGPKPRLPFGNYRASLKLELVMDAGKPYKGSADLVFLAKTSHAPYAEIKQHLAADTVNSFELDLTFENSFPSSPILFDVILRGSVFPAKLRIVDLQITPDELAKKSA